MTEITSAILSALEDHEWVGIRAHDDVVAVGAEFDDSRIWDNGEPTDETLHGVSTIQIKSADKIADAMDRIQSYLGEYLSVVAGDSGEWGEDEGEAIIHRGVCVATGTR